MHVEVIITYSIKVAVFPVLVSYLAFSQFIIIFKIIPQTITASSDRHQCIFLHNMVSYDITYWGERERTHLSYSTCPPVCIYVRTFWSPGGPVLCTNIKQAGLHPARSGIRSVQGRIWLWHCKHESQPRH